MPFSESSLPPKWGYLVEDPPYPHAPGGRRLILHLLAKPTEAHFDPAKVTFPVVEPVAHGPTGERYALSWLTVEHPWEGRREHRVAAGRVRAWDHANREVVWFTFGGTLTVERHPQHTTARLTSPAPILEVSGAENELVRLLADEAEELLAQRRAAHLPDRLEGLAQRMAVVDPWLLYCAVCQALEAKFAALPQQPVEERFLAFLRSHLQMLQETQRCPQPIPPLEALL